jgi:hypothetical protein
MVTSRWIDRRIALSNEWDYIVKEVRRIPGFEDYLQPRRIQALLPAARNGPIVVPNVSPFRSDALIVTEDGVDVTGLPELTAADVITRTRDYVLSLLQYEAAADALELASQHLSHASLDAIARYTVAKQNYVDARGAVELTLVETMEWLWDYLANPVLSALGFLGAPEVGGELPRMWWCPTGWLNLLPLHSAGYHNDNRSPGRTVIDRLVPSYTPTLRALLDAPNEDSFTNPRMLIVGMAETPGQQPLRAVADEQLFLSRVFADQHTLVTSSTATKAEVLAALPRHDWVHFSCHADQDLTEPNRAGFLLADEKLTIGEISAGDSAGEFAFLSACKTATGGLTLADEAITLASALHYTGYRHVIGTLWSVKDRQAADIAASVYTELTNTGEFVPANAARALHTTIKRHRDQYPLRPSLWVPYVHIGA